MGNQMDCSTMCTGRDKQAFTNNIKMCESQTIGKGGRKTLSSSYLIGLDYALGTAALKALLEQHQEEDLVSLLVQIAESEQKGIDSKVQINEQVNNSFSSQNLVNTIEINSHKSYLASQISNSNDQYSSTQQSINLPSSLTSEDLLAMFKLNQGHNILSLAALPRLDIDPKTQGYLHTHLSEKLKKVVRCVVSKVDNNIFNAAYCQEKDLILSTEGLYVLKSPQEVEVKAMLQDINALIDYKGDHRSNLGVLFRQQIEVDGLSLYDDKNIVNLMNLSFDSPAQKQQVVEIMQRQAVNKTGQPLASIELEKSPRHSEEVVAQLREIVTEQYQQSKISLMDCMSMLQSRDKAIKTKGEMVGMFEVFLVSVKQSAQAFDIDQIEQDDQIHLTYQKSHKLLGIFRQHLVLIYRSTSLNQHSQHNVKCIPLKKITQVVMSRNRKILLIRTKKNNILVESKSLEYIAVTLCKLVALENTLSKKDHLGLRFSIFNEVLLLQQLTQPPQVPPQMTQSNVVPSKEPSSKQAKSFLI